MVKFLGLLVVLFLSTKGFATYDDFMGEDEVCAPSGMGVHDAVDEEISAHLAFLRAHYPFVAHVFNAPERTFWTALCEAVMAMSPLTDVDERSARLVRLQTLVKKHTLVDELIHPWAVSSFLSHLMEGHQGDLDALFYSKNTFKRYLCRLQATHFLKESRRTDIVAWGPHGQILSGTLFDVAMDPKDDGPYVPNA